MERFLRILLTAPLDVRQDLFISLKRHLSVGFICGVLRNLVPFVQLIKREKP